MTADLARLQAFLADRYAIERELGRGGMATVYLARDLKHDRLVAIKVLRPELAAALGPERFLREIRLAAQLNHPHILPLHDSGEAGGFLYYTMPFVEGESLRDRLDRDKQLPLEEAIQIAREVGDALAYAHSRGVIHRDIKPENVLLESGHAVVADFGIAKAIGEAGGARLTGTGFSVGTPAYMSPEQALGQEVDGRSDVYALGCVLYELLAGEPPYTGPTAQAIIAKRLSEPLPSLRVVREAVPESVEQAIAKALARTPADRFATAGQFVAALKTGPSGGWADGESRGGQRILRWAILAVLAVGLGIGTWAVVHRMGRAVVSLDPNLIAVFPFRISGTDTGLARLEGGMVDLLEVKFAGEEGGPRVLPARTALAAWRDATGPGGSDLSEQDAAALARGLGSGSLVLGTIVATPERLIMSGSLLDAGTGKLRAQAKVEGAPDSLMGLVDAFAVQLVALNAGEKRDRLSSLTTTSLSALYAYLAGRADHRAGRFAEAIAHFDHALELDSTFALAALADVQSSGWADWQGRSRRLRVAQAHRDRLGTKDQLILEALEAEHGTVALAAWQKAIDRAPDDPDALTYIGDLYFHEGALMGLYDPNALAADALRRALALDTALNVEPMIHLIQIAEAEGDTAEVRRLINRFPPGTLGPGGEVLAASVLGDSAMLARARRNLDSLGGHYGVMMDAQLLGVAVPEAERAMRTYLSRANSPAQRLERYGFDAYFFKLNLGRPAAAAAAFREAAATLGQMSDPSIWRHYLFGNVLWTSIFDGGDSAVAAGAIVWLTRRVNAPLASRADEAQAQLWDLCTLTMWRLAHGDTTGAGSAMGRLRGVGDGYCNNTFLRLLLVGVTHAPDSTDTLLEAERRALGSADSWIWNLFLARVREARGDLVAALRLIRSRPGYSPPVVLAYPLREEGRLAALTGDTVGAIRAYHHYLALRYNPEPSVKPQVDSVRAELGRLVGEHPRR